MTRIERLILLGVATLLLVALTVVLAIVPYGGPGARGQTAGAKRAQPEFGGCFILDVCAPEEWKASHAVYFVWKGQRFVLPIAVRDFKKSGGGSGVGQTPAWTTLNETRIEFRCDPPDTELCNGKSGLRFSPFVGSAPPKSYLVQWMAIKPLSYDRPAETPTNAEIGLMLATLPVLDLSKDGGVLFLPKGIDATPSPSGP